VKQPFWRAVATITALVYVVSSLPYLAGYAFETATIRFTGIVFDVPDTAQYYAWMRAFAHSPLIANPLTPEPGLPRFFNLQWWLLGLLAFDTPLGPDVTYQILRLVAIVAFAATVALFCTLTVPWQRLLAFALVFLSSGFGWTLVVAKQLLGELYFPLAVQVAEANTYFSAMAFPHLLVAGALSLGIFSATLRWMAEGPRAWRRWLLPIVVLTLALGFSHGYDLIPTMAIPCATVALIWFRRKQIAVGLALPAVAIVASATLPAFYLVALTRLDSTWRGVLAQYGNGGVYTPLPPLLIVLLGLPFILSWWQVRPVAWRTDDFAQLFLRVWLVVGGVLLYIPTDFQIKMLTAYQVPICLLAAQTLAEFAARPAWVSLRVAARPALALAAVLAFVALTNGYLTAWRVVELRRTTYPYYLAADDRRALELLGRVTMPGDVVLSSTEVGIFVPVYSDARPFVAHWAQSLDFYRRRDLAARVYRPATGDAERRAVVAGGGIAFVIAGPAERHLGAGLPERFEWQPLAAPQAETVVYRIAPVASSGGQR
jgi:hypothetical protein